MTPFDVGKVFACGINVNSNAELGSIGIWLPILGQEVGFAWQV
jgi:hypothetical protein